MKLRGPREGDPCETRDGTNPAAGATILVKTLYNVPSL